MAVHVLCGRLRHQQDEWNSYVLTRPPFAHASASPEGIVVLGIPVASQRTAKLVRKVMMVSSAMAVRALL